MFFVFKFNVLGPFVNANSSGSETNLSNPSRQSLEDLDPLAIHHLTLTAINVLRYEGALHLSTELLENTQIMYN